MTLDSIRNFCNVCNIIVASCHKKNIYLKPLWFDTQISIILCRCLFSSWKNETKFICRWKMHSFSMQNFDNLEKSSICAVPRTPTINRTEIGFLLFFKNHPQMYFNVQRFKLNPHQEAFGHYRAISWQTLEFFWVSFCLYFG